MKRLDFPVKDYLDFSLVAIQTSISNEAQFIYRFNKHFKTFFRRSNELDISVNCKEFCYSVYVQEDDSSDTVYQLIKNKPISDQQKQGNNGLSSLFDIRPFLLPNFKHYNYFLKIEASQKNDFYQNISIVEGLIDAIKKIKTPYGKRFENLIF